ncbi:MAG: CRTAC1 family protein, partial [Halobacteriovoraceae bacterium]|nr:CRTAC1 family protein [Halobacteriovoraceae bacterium]
YQILKGETLVSTKPSFINTTTASIGNNVPIYKREEAIRRGGYALAISDYDGDGIQDMYVGAAEKGTLLRGLGNGKFAKANIPAIENYSLVKAAVWGDYFNTGRQDLLLVRFTPNESAAKKSDVVMFENLGGGKFKERKGWFKIKNNSDYAMPVAVADLNGDKLLDFYIGYPGAKDFTILGESHYDNKKLQVQGLFLNQGKGKFKDFSREALGESAFQRIYPHSAMSVDYDQDGDMDLVVIDDRGNLSPVYKNDGHGKFTQTADEIGVGNKDWGMGIAAGDINNDGRLDFAMTNVNFMAAKRINKSCIHNWEHDNFSKLGHQGLRTFGQTGNGKFVETTKANGLEWMGEGAAGVEFMDYNNDGHLDIYVVNGLWSGDKQRKEQDLSSLFVRASGLNLLEEDLHALHGKKKVHAPAKDSYWDYLQYRSKSQSAVMLTLSNFKGDIHQGGKDSYRPSLAGFQRNRLFRNNGNGSFTEVGFLEGVDSIKDGYIISQTDLNKDGKMDFVLRNCDPGTRENWFSPVEVFINNNNEKKKSLTLNLEGRASNRDAIGSFVTGVVQGRKFIRHLIANNGTAQSEKILHIGMGNAKVIDRLTVHWPSGTVQNFKNVKAGHLKIVEGNDLERMANK